MIGLGLMPHQIGWKDAKKMNPFAFTPGYVQLDTTTNPNQYRSCYSPSFSGSGGNPEPLFTTNFIGEHGAQGGYPVMNQSAIDSMKCSRNKGPKYQGIFYEFYEMWLIAMYLELGSLRFTDIDSFGSGCAKKTPDASNWISGGSSGVHIKKGKGKGTDDYSALMDGSYKIGEGGNNIAPLNGLLGDNKYNFEEALESQRFVDALVKSNLTSKVDGATVLEYDADGNVRVPLKEVNLSTGENMDEGKKYYIIRNVPNCQGIGDGVMTYVLNVFVKTSFNSGVTYNSVDVGGNTVIFKFSYPTYRGLELFSGAFTQIEGINYVVGNRSNKTEGSIWYAKDYTDIKYDPNKKKPTDYKVPIDEDIPYIKGFVKGGEYDGSNSGWVKNANYDVSLYCTTECGDKIASESTYECGYVRRTNSTNNGYKEVAASVVGCGANDVEFGRTLHAYYVGAIGYGDCAGGFSIGNPSLHPTHSSDSGTTISEAIEG